MGDAAANLFAQQNQAALQNQQTGVQAGIGAGNVAQQDINNALTVGQYQQASPFANISNYGKVIGGVQAPTTVSNQTQLSPLNQIMGAVNLLGGSTGSGGALAQIFGTGTKGQSGYQPGFLGSLGNYLGFGGTPAAGGGGGTLPPTTGDNPDSGDYNGVDYGNTGPVLPPSTGDNLDSGDYNGVDYGNSMPAPDYSSVTEPDYSADYGGFYD
jgi:hypothetical protein